MAEVSWREWVRTSGSTAVLTGASTVLMGTLPLLNGLFADRLHLDWHQLGWLGTAAQSGTLCGTLLGFWLSGRGSSRIGIQLGAACALLAWLFAAFAASFGQLVFCRTLTAIGIGCAFSIGTYLLARSEPQARSFSVMSGVQVVCGALHSAVLPWLHSRFGYVSAVASLALWFALMLGLSPSVRSPQVDVADRSAKRDGSGLRSPAASLLLSVMTFQMAAMTFWAYSERIAATSGLPESDIATAISIGNLGGVPAALLGALAGERFGFIPILLLATVAAVGGEVAMAGASTAGAYLAGQLVFNFGWILGVSYYLALLSKRAHDARIIRSAPIALVIAGVLGPLPVALLDSVSNTSGLLTFTVMLSLIALIPTLIRRG